MVIDESKTRYKQFKTILRVVSGNFLEMFDFMVFGFYITAISKTFFPDENEFASLMFTLATYGTGFLMRPLGAIILGSYVDIYGRRKGLLLTLSLMAMGTLLIACVPGYKSIGWLAPILVVIGRLLQGFSAGAELGGVSVYLAEIAPAHQKGFYVAWQSGSQQIAVIFAAVLGVILSAILSKQQMQNWGWRIPFLMGCLIIPILFWIRRSLEETEVFKRKKTKLSIKQTYLAMLQEWKLVIGGALTVAMSTTTFYLITAYTPLFGERELHLTEYESLLITVCVGFSNLFWLPVMGSVSDKIGRRPLLIAITSLAILTAYPAMSWLVIDPSFSKLLIVLLWFSLLFASYNGALVVWLTEIMPTDVRAAGFSLAWSLATAIFGGFTPSIATALIKLTEDKAAPALWLTFAAICALCAGVAVAHFAKQRNQLALQHT